jgi:hypothetical protein
MILYRRTSKNSDRTPVRNKGGSATYYVCGLGLRRIYDAGNNQSNVGAAMNNCPWEEINGFQSPGEFQRFERWIAEQIQLGNAEEMLVNF